VGISAPDTEGDCGPKNQAPIVTQKLRGRVAFGPRRWHRPAPSFDCPSHARSRSTTTLLAGELVHDDGGLAIHAQKSWSRTSRRPVALTQARSGMQLRGCRLGRRLGKRRFCAQWPIASARACGSLIALSWSSSGPKSRPGRGDRCRSRTSSAFGAAEPSPVMRMQVIAFTMGSMAVNYGRVLRPVRVNRHLHAALSRRADAPATTDECS
jgi:hypothetical protein